MSVYERLSGLAGTCARLECSSRALVYFERSLICDTGVALIAAEPRDVIKWRLLFEVVPAS